MEGVLALSVLFFQFPVNLLLSQKVQNFKYVAILVDVLFHCGFNLYLSDNS